MTMTSQFDSNYVFPMDPIDGCVSDFDEDEDAIITDTQVCTSGAQPLSATAYQSYQCPHKHSHH
jgi:hypothetical protein